MQLSRREFVGYAAAAFSARATIRPLAPRHDCVVLPVPGECTLPESVLGYRSTLVGVHTSLLVIPALMELPHELGILISQRLHDGGIVLVESGAGFAAARDFARHWRSLLDVLDVAVAGPVVLGSADQKSRRVPYVDYLWPRPVKVRDFTRGVSTDNHADNIIAFAGDLPVGLRRRVGAGTMIFLGSPLGPALWAGDREAQGWLQLICTGCAGT